ncbi:hypothetical protein [Dictyobacter aurantiacus]|uniref:Uncharacterized protein n=1 Tax=Dictyobacter aurantiacus TaxID=1936993 RepID=A0A401ZL29_9CHLR|nr:hypothetical protein [Dictyobacter aurantiacus]GCE07569.1 hypothetical protein KDAU_48980 [Dictyobacter aurantiacus]
MSASACIRCGTPLQNYIQLLNYPARLFNEGLVKARHGEFEQARDLFAAVVYWCPRDLEARNALAMACLAMHDLLEARRQWEYVLHQAPADALAQRGLQQITAQPPSTSSPEPVPAPSSTPQAHTNIKHAKKQFFGRKKGKKPS